GAEAWCRAVFKDRGVEGTARLETDVLQFRGEGLRLSIPFREILNLSARDGMLQVTWPHGIASFDLGAAAARWAQKILHPTTRLVKLGVKPTWRASAVGVVDQDFLKELEAAVALLSIGRVLKNSDAIFFGAHREAELARLEKLKMSLKQDGALWIIRPKGRAEIPERAVMQAGRAAGLVDVKVVSLSPIYTAEKFVIPRHARGT